MSDTMLDITLTFRADESTTRKIRNKIANPDTGDCDLGNVLSTIVQQTLIAAGVSEDFKVKFKCGQVKTHFASGGGLSAQEWMETDETPEGLTDSENLLSQNRD